MFEQSPLARWRPRGAGELWPRLLRLSGGALALGVALALASWTQLFVHPLFGLDLAIYLDALHKAAAGANPYTPFLIGDSYIYPPPALLIVAPLAPLPTATAAMLWRIVSLLAYLGALVALYSAYQGRLGRAETLGLLVVALAFAPLWETLQVGQVNSLVLLGIALFILGHRRPAWAAAGDAGLALAIVLKISPAMLLLLPLVSSDRRRLLRVGAALAGLTAISLLWPGLRVWAEFLEIAPRLFEGGNANPFNLALGSMLERALPGPVGPWVGRLLSLGLLAGWGAACVAGRRGAGPHTLALGVALMTAASGLIWYHHLVFLAVPAAALMLRPDSSRLAAISLAALALIQANRLIEFGLTLPAWPAVAGYLIIVAAALVGLWPRRA